ncbi:MAG: hypothetical protein FRX49_03044 [Trebouxia sp. A1-2]|nr:MAG: hypothetical protein FRX49_03044 [Trebouxia sp. A1-2]
MSSNGEQELLSAILTDNRDQPDLTPLLQDPSMPDGHSARRKRKRQLPSGSLHDPQQQLSDDFLEEHLNHIIHDDPVCTDTVAGKNAVPSSAFRLDDPLIPELLSWISCAAILGGLAGSVAVGHGVQTAGAAASLLPALKRRNSGKRNLHRPWTTVEEALLTRLVEQADYRKQVLNTSRLSKSGWAKIAHHLGRSGSSGVSGIKLKYRTLKEQADKSAGNTDNAAMNGRNPPRIVFLPADCFVAANSVPRSPFQTAATTGPAVVPASGPASASIQSSGRGSKVTACSLAIMGLQHLPGHAGTSKQIMTAVESDPMLAKALNWETDKLGKVRWRSSITCVLSAEKSGIFQKTGRKQEGHIVWQLDEFRATNELKRHTTK